MKNLSFEVLRSSQNLDIDLTNLISLDLMSSINGGSHGTGVCDAVCLPEEMGGCVPEYIDPCPTYGMAIE